MASVTSLIPFLKSETEALRRRAERSTLEDRPSLAVRYKKRADSFQALLKFAQELAELQRIAREASERSVSLSELADLPEKLRSELRISDSDKLEFDIVQILEKQGGVANLDRILVELYKARGEIHKRQDMNSRLYRMSKKGMIHSVSGRRGVYSNMPVPSDDAQG